MLHVPKANYHLAIQNRKCFYMSVRPGDSQEQAGMVDAPGGVLNPDFKNADF